MRAVMRAHPRDYRHTSTANPPSPSISLPMRFLHRIVCSGRLSPSLHSMLTHNRLFQRCHSMSPLGLPDAVNHACIHATADARRPLIPVALHSFNDVISASNCLRSDHIPRRYAACPHTQSSTSSLLFDDPWQKHQRNVGWVV